MKFWAFALLPLLLTGCEPGRRAAQPPPVQQPAPPMTDISVDPLGGGDSASGGSATPGAGSDTPVMPDPMRSSSDSGEAPPDPLAAGGDPLKGAVMPTQHSHWLRGRTRGAELTVLLNGVRQGSYQGVVDRDITMKLRSGLNFVTFNYQPKDANSYAQMEIVESEHSPPIAPLATFRSPPAPFSATRTTQPMPQVMKTYSFIAK